MMHNVITPQIQSDFRNLTLLVRILLSSNNWFLSKTCNCLTVILIHKFPQALRVKSSPTLKKSNTLFQYCKHSVYFSSNYLMIFYAFHPCLFSSFQLHKFFYQGTSRPFSYIIKPSLDMKPITISIVFLVCFMCSTT